MDAIWYFSGQHGIYSVPDQQFIVNNQGDLLPFASTCAEEPVSLTDFVQLCQRHKVVLLAVDQGRFDDAYLKSIPVELARLALISPHSTEAARHQVENLGVDAFVFAGMNHNDFASIMKKAVEDKQAVNALQDELKKYSDIAFTAMSSASEMGTVALLAESAQSAIDLSQLARAVINCIRDLGMDSIVQFKFDAKVSVFPETTSATHRRVLESALSSNSRIISHGRFLVFSFNNIQVLILNAPSNDSDKYGRMRDVLAQVASIAESRAKTLQVNEMLKEQQDNARMVMMLLEMASRDNRNSVKEIMTELSFSLRQMAMGLDLTLAQETAMTSLADKALESLEGLQQATIAVEDHFRSLLQQLDNAANLLHNKIKSAGTENSVDGNKVELF
jgi:hypothetical protein